MNIQEAVAYFSKFSRDACFEVLCREPLFILDGGHSPECAEALTEALSTCLPGEKPLFLTGVPADKDYERILDLIAPYAAGFVCVRADSDRAMDAEDLAALLTARGFAAQACPSVEEGIRTALSLSAEEDLRRPVVAFGSLNMARAVRKAFPLLCKKQQRKTIVKRRRAMTQAERDEKSLQICERLKTLFAAEPWRSCRTVFSYRGTWEEVNTDRFNTWAEDSGFQVAYPVSLPHGIMKALVPETENAWKRGAYDIPEPDPEHSRVLEAEEVDVIIVPCVAFDRQGNRCGHGAGYYDRYIAACEEKRGSGRTALLMVAFDAQEVRTLMTEGTDIPIHWILTESKTWDCRAK